MIARRLGDLLLALALIGVVGWPLLATARAAVGGWGGDGSGQPARPGEIVRPLGLAWETARLVVAAEAMAMPAGVALAFLLCRTDAWGRRAMLGAVLLAAFVPTPLHATAWLGGFGNAGRSQALGAGPWLVGWPGAAFIHAAAALPWIVLIVGVGLRSVEPELEDAARLDLPPWRVAWQVTLRRCPGYLAAAALAVAVQTAGDMTVTDLLLVRTYAEEAYIRYQMGDAPGAAASALLPLIVLGGLIFAGSTALLRLDPARLASAASRARDWPLGRWRVPVGMAILMTAGNLVALPLYSLVWRAGRVGGVAGRPPTWSPSGLAGTIAASAGELVGPAFRDPFESPMASSLILAAIAATGTAALAWCLAWKSRRSAAWRWITAATLAATLATPGPVAGMALVLGYIGWPRFYDSPGLVILAFGFRTLPYALLVAWPAVRGLPPEILEAAEVDGCGPLGQAIRVGVPLTRAAIAASWGVAFALAMGELPAANQVVPPGTSLLSVRVWGLLHTGVESKLAGIGLVTLAILALPAWIAGRGLARLSPR
ncbi:ABC transporter permease [Tundrisphaera sp. TA3]|uniref:ABC transporter permease n=1 Tax=Tundrisphaera sp. TA3 TaxID=3435775 RepID=UPI003EB9F599